MFILDCLVSTAYFGFLSKFAVIWSNNKNEHEIKKYEKIGTIKDLNEK